MRELERAQVRYVCERAQEWELRQHYEMVCERMCRGVRKGVREGVRKRVREGASEGV